MEFLPITVIEVPIIGGPCTKLDYTKLIQVTQAYCLLHIKLPIIIAGVTDVFHYMLSMNWQIVVSSGRKLLNFNVCNEQVLQIFNKIYWTHRQIYLNKVLLYSTRFQIEFLIIAVKKQLYSLVLTCPPLGYILKFFPNIPTRLVQFFFYFLIWWRLLGCTGKGQNFWPLKAIKAARPKKAKKAKKTSMAQNA